LGRPPRKEQQSVLRKATEAPGLRGDSPAPFAAGDVYVSMGFDWKDKDLEQLASVRRIVGIRTLLCCYDLIPVVRPHLAAAGDIADRFAKYIADLVWCADELIVISQYTNQDLSAFLVDMGAPVPPSTVVRLGSDLPRPMHATSIGNSFPFIDRRFILLVSSIDRRKNHEVIYRAYVRLIEQGKTDLPLAVFVGKQGAGVKDFMADVKFDPRTRGLIHILHDVSDSELTLLYRNCMFTVFPSLYEGWGLAVAESLAMGKFCLASPAASIREIGGDLVEYVDPLSVPQWAERLHYYFDHPQAIADAESRIRETYVAPKWEDTARAVFDRATTLRDRR
jgi:glycosyltransferase involved in cell wall biosynthesis